MPTYHFHIDEGRDHTHDRFGVELDNLVAVRREATILAGELLRDRPDRFWDTQDWTMTVEDSSGLLLFRIHIDAVAAPATIHQLRG